MKINRNVMKTLIRIYAQNEVTFTKTNGATRVMICTTQKSMIPEIHYPVGDTEVKENPDVMRVFDLEKNAWRSFRIDAVTNIVCMNADGEVVEVAAEFYTE